MVLFWFCSGYCLFVRFLTLKELELLKNKKIKLTEKDLHIIDVYSKKNLSDTMPQFGNLEEKVARPMQEMTNLQKQK